MVFRLYISASYLKTAKNYVCFFFLNIPLSIPAGKAIAFIRWLPIIPEKNNGTDNGSRQDSDVTKITVRYIIHKIL